ncbi:MAG: SGNH/GDSL hydrolase family protein [Opitutaceae bacterium]|nr:SGNH/GDSL hydrolase family protein [Opitutaceae bacterium]
MRSPTRLLLFILVLGLCPASALLAQTAPAKKATAAKAKQPEPALTWHDVTTWGVEGRAFGDMPRKRWFDRLPAVAEGKVTDAVWGLSRDSAGMMVRFKSDATLLWADYTLNKSRLAGANMTAIGASGLDLYARDDAGKWRWVGVTRPDGQTVRQEIIAGLKPGLREYAVYLPLYNGIEKLSLGVPPGAKFEPLAPRAEKPIVFYGTSITHGASATRPGMVHTAILGRRFDRPVINLGFSGNGRMDAAVGELLVTIDAAVFVIDCLPNMGAALVRERTIPLVRQLRAARPETPIVLVEDRRNTNSWILPARNQHHTDNHAALREAFATLQKEGVKHLHYIAGDDLLGHDDEAATDGSHPSDLGFMRQAHQFEPVLREALAGR